MSWWTASFRASWSGSTRNSLCWSTAPGGPGPRTGSRRSCAKRGPCSTPCSAWRRIPLGTVTGCRSQRPRPTDRGDPGRRSGGRRRTRLRRASPAGWATGNPARSMADSAVPVRRHRLTSRGVACRATVIAPVNSLPGPLESRLLNSPVATRVVAKVDLVIRTWHMITPGSRVVDLVIATGLLILIYDVSMHSGFLSSILGLHLRCLVELDGGLPTRPQADSRRR